MSCFLDLGRVLYRAIRRVGMTGVIEPIGRKGSPMRDVTGSPSPYAVCAHYRTYRAVMAAAFVTIVGPNGSGNVDAVQAIIGFVRLRRILSVMVQDLLALPASQRAHPAALSRKAAGLKATAGDLELGAYTAPAARLAATLERIHTRSDPRGTSDNCGTLSGGESRSGDRPAPRSAPSC